MALIETKYSVGDKVWFADTIVENKQHPCPDCLGERKWKAISPAGAEFEFACPRCSNRYLSDHRLSLNYAAHVPSVRQLTIGSVQFNSASGSWDEGARYMCVETGVGGGSVYNEDRLFETEEEALAHAHALAATANSTITHIVEQYNKTLDISDYQLENAQTKLAKEASSSAHCMVWNIGELLDEIEKAESKDDILELIEDYRRYTWERDKAKASEAEACA